MQASCCLGIRTKIQGQNDEHDYFIFIFLQTVLGCSAFMTGVMMTPGAVISIFMSPISGLLFDKFGPRAISILGLTALTAALFGLAFVGPDTRIAFLIFIYVLQSFGLTIAKMPVNTWGINALDNAYIAHGNAISNTGRQVCGQLMVYLQQRYSLLCYWKFSKSKTIVEKRM